MELFYNDLFYNEFFLQEFFYKHFLLPVLTTDKKSAEIEITKLQ